MDFMEKLRQGLSRVDGWVNLVTGMGTQSRSKAVNFQAGDRLAEETLEALFVGDPYANRICRVVPEEALRQGFAVKTGDAGEESAIAAHLDRWRVAGHLAGAWTWSRVFGGGAIFVGADDGLDPREPLNEAAVRTVRFLVVADRRDLVPLTWNADDESARYGEPETYSLTRISSGGGSQVVVVHASRLVRFEGALTTRRRRTQLRGWGESELQRLYDVLSKFNGAWESTATLIYQGSIGVLGMKNLFSMMAADKRDVLKTRLDVMDLAMASTRNVIIDADGESDVRWFYDRIKSAQTAILMPRLLRLTRLLLLAKDGPTGGVAPADLAVEFAPLWQMTPGETADLRLKVAQTDQIYQDLGSLTPEEIAAARFRPEGWSMETTVDFEARDEAQGADEDANASVNAPGADHAEGAAAIIAKVAARELPRDAGVALLQQSMGMAPEAAESAMGEAGRTFFTAPEAGHAAAMDAMKGDLAKAQASVRGHQAYTARLIQRAKDGGLELGAFTAKPVTETAEGDELEAGDVVAVPVDPEAPAAPPAP